MISFKILKKSRKSNARLGILKTFHGEVETPAFVPVATQGVVKTLTSEEALLTKSQILIANTFHLHLKPGEGVVKAGGGLHKFMNWKRPLMTDSGGFQVFSLGFGKDFSHGKILTNDQRPTTNDRIKKGSQPSKLKITERGVRFRSPIDGKEIYLTPKKSVQIQVALGADIIFAFDECTSPLATKKYTEESLVKTHRWAKESLRAKKKGQAMYGIVQGGKYKDLRKVSAQLIGQLSFDGFGIGGEFGDSKSTMTEMLKIVFEELPEEKPRHLLGIGHLEDIPRIIKSGVDTFDCIVPTHYARHGYAFTSPSFAKASGGKHEKLNLGQSKFLKDKNPLDKKCNCKVCNIYSRSYISHLVRAKEITGLSLLTFHNLYFFNSFVENIRREIKRGVL